MKSSAFRHLAQRTQYLASAFPSTLVMTFIDSRSGASVRQAFFASSFIQAGHLGLPGFGVGSLRLRLARQLPRSFRMAVGVGWGPRLPMTISKTCPEKNQRHLAIETMVQVKMEFTAWN